MTYHLHTEWKPNLATLAAKYFPGFTLSPAKGYWQGHPEKAALIEIDTHDARKIRLLARDIRRTNHQTAVLVEALSSHTFLER